MAVPKEEEYYSYKDYRNWDDADGRFELVDGVAYAMSSASRGHQWASGFIYSEMAAFFRGKKCRPIQDFDIRIDPKEDDSDDTVFRPDISVLCDGGSTKDISFKGAPDLVVEILSPSTALFDLNVKKWKYLGSGVKELWLVDLENQKVEINISAVSEGNNQCNTRIESEILKSSRFEGLVIDLKALWAYVQ
jgi:Uma2 family endonuclease